MRKPHMSIPWALGFVVAAAGLVVVVGCGGNNKPPMTPDGPEMDLDASAPPAATAAPTPSAVPTMPRKIPG